MLLLILLAPLVGGAVVAAAHRHRQAAWVAVAANATVLGAGISLACRVVWHGPVTAAGGVLRADALSAFMVIVIGVVALLASSAGIRTIGLQLAGGTCTPGRATLYGVLVQLFVGSMLLAVLAANVGVLWIAVETTTVVTTFLVGHSRTRGALEASWKYIVICSVGIALAFLGTVLVYLAATHGSSHSAGALAWTSLMAGAHHLNPSVLRLGFALVVLGYGTKVGLAPMHAWLPDAHSQAPAPVSALMSGVLLSVSFYAIVRFKAVVDVALGPGYSRTLLVIVALVSLAVAASLLIAQRDYKRMLAYSSIEHMGLVALGAAAGTPLAMAAVLFHIVGHGLAKSVLFLTSGELMAAEGTSRIDEVRNLLYRRPALGGLFAAGLVAVLGLPPFSLFSSELLMARAEFQAGLGWAAAIALAAVLVVFVAVIGHARRMLLGSPASAVEPARTPGWVIAPLVCGLSACALIGVVAWPLSELLLAAGRTVAS
jgi:hydrogenase-4 component F